MAYITVLHTNSSYAENNIDDSNLINSSNLNNKYSNDIAQLQSIEQSFYSKIKIKGQSYTDFLSFMKALQALFRECNLDIEAFKKFRNTEITKALANYDKNNFDASADVKALTQENTILYINLTKANQEIKEKFRKALDEALEGLTVIKGKSDDEFSINFQANTEKMKAFLNTQAFKIISQKKGYYKEKSSDIRALRDFIRNNIADNANKFFYFDYGKQFAQNTRLSINNPFSKTINKYSKYTENEIRKIMDSIHHFLKTTFQGSNDFNIALENTWNNNIYNAIDKKIREKVNNKQSLTSEDYSELGLFVKGGYLTTLAGAFGEFQAALLGEYLKIKKCSAEFNPIISNTLQKGEQAKVDVSLMEGIGFQIKNYNPNSSIEESEYFSTNIHPTELFKFNSFKSATSKAFLPFLANYFFNMSYQGRKKATLDELEKSLEDIFRGEISNLSVQEQVHDTVSFYLINGQYLIPGSVILQNLIAKEKSLAMPVQITGGTYENRAMTDLGFYSSEAYKVKGSKKDRKGWYARRYWHKSGGEFHPTGENSSWYNNLISNQISIRSEFNYKDLFESLKDVGGYSLF